MRGKALHPREGPGEPFTAPAAAHLRLEPASLAFDLVTLQVFGLHSPNLPRLSLTGEFS